MIRYMQNLKYTTGVFYEHFLHLLVHGILHLLGYDHQSAADAERMEELEISVLKDFAISSPYI